MSQKPFARHDNVRIVGKLAVGARGRIVDYTTGQIKKVVVVPFVGGTDTAGGILTWVNTEQGTILINRATVLVDTVATGACAADVGTSATVADSTNLLTALDVHTATGVFDNIGTPGASGKALQTLAQNQYVTVSKASGASAGLVGRLVLEYAVLV